MFDYPVLLPAKSHYALFDVGPEATAQELGDGRAALIKSLKAERAAIDARIDAARQAVPGWYEAEQKVRYSSGKGEAGESVVAEARRDLAEFALKASRIDPEYRDHQRRSDELACQVEEINALRLENPDERAAYDRSLPPLAILKLPDGVRDRFAISQRITLQLLRREISHFLEDRGEEVFHPSDLTREDFSEDFTETPFLDRVDT